MATAYTEPKGFLIAHERNELSRAATALYLRGAGAAGTLLSVVAATGGASLQQVDAARAVYRAWLVFDEVAL